MRSWLLSVACCVCVAGAPVAAFALPGQSLTQFTAWAHANPALHGLTKKISEMSALPYFAATFRAGSHDGNFLANVGEGNTIENESVAVSGPQQYDILLHPDVASALLAVVYGPSIAADFRAATKVGSWKLHEQTQATSLFRGTHYGYEAAYSFVELVRLTDVDGEAKRLATCVKQECGD